MDAVAPMRPLRPHIARKRSLLSFGSAFKKAHRQAVKVSAFPPVGVAVAQTSILPEHGYSADVPPLIFGLNPRLSLMLLRESVASGRNQRAETRPAVAEQLQAACADSGHGLGASWVACDGFGGLGHHASFSALKTHFQSFTSLSIHHASPNLL